MQALDPRQFRFRHFVGIVLTAILAAALLRHALHVYFGFSRENIRANALIVAVAIAAATILSRKIYRR